MFQLVKIAIAAMLTASLSSMASAQVQWTTMAGTGTVRPGSKLTLSPDAFVACNPEATGMGHVTYNLPLPSLLLAHSNTAMAVRFRDAGGSSDWIIVRLKEYDPTTGYTYTHMNFNSNSFSSSNDWQEGWITSTFDFNPYRIYYLEAELFHSSLTPPPPILCSIRLWRY